MAAINAALSLPAPSVPAFLAHPIHVPASSSAGAAASASYSIPASAHLRPGSSKVVTAVWPSRRPQGQSCVSSSWRRGCSSVRERDLRTYAAENDKGRESVDSDVNVDELEARLGVRRKTQKRQGEALTSSSAKSTKVSKGWDEMTFPEKAWSLYIGEKGILFWINKLAYILIFVTIGGWIAFRFLGPALGLYQLEGDILPPSQVFRGE